MGNSNNKSKKRDPVPRPFMNMGSAELQLSEQGQRIVDDVVNKKREEHSHILNIAYGDYEYPFENLAFEGGGTKGAVYAGVVQL